MSLKTLTKNNIIVEIISATTTMLNSTTFALGSDELCFVSVSQNLEMTWLLLDHSLDQSELLQSGMEEKV